MTSVYGFTKKQIRGGQALKLDQLQSNKPQQCWKERNELGPKRIKTIPMESVRCNGENECFFLKKNKQEVLGEMVVRFSRCILWKIVFHPAFMISSHMISLLKKT